MIVDQRKHIRDLAYKKILNSRSRRQSNLRTFKKLNVSQLNFECDDYVDMINWKKLVILEPPYTQKFTTEELKKFMNCDEVIEILNIPSHTQATEHCIQAMTDKTDI